MVVAIRATWKLEIGNWKLQAVGMLGLTTKMGLKWVVVMTTHCFRIG
jgi:hypothetical protein